MAWTSAPRPSHPAPLGFRAQLLAMGAPFGPAHALLALHPHWLLALARARALAAGAAEARLAVDTLFAELAAVTGLAAPTWPAHFDRPAADPTPPGPLEELAPGQALLLDPGTRACPRSRAVAAALAAQAFGPRPGGGLSRTDRIRAAAPVVPAPLRARWLCGVHLDLPPAAADTPGARALALTRAAFPQVDTVSPCTAPADLAAGIDALLVALCLRLSLRLSGALELAIRPEPSSAPATGPAEAPAEATLVTPPPSAEGVTQGARGSVEVPTGS